MLVICTWILSGGRVKTFQQSMEILLRWVWEEEEKNSRKEFRLYCFRQVKAHDLSVEQTFHYHTSTMQHPKSRSIVPLRRKYFLPGIIDSSLFERHGLLMTRLCPVHRIYSSIHSRIKTWLIMFLLEIINSIISFYIYLLFSFKGKKYINYSYILCFYYIFAIRLWDFIFYKII